MRLRTKILLGFLAPMILLALVSVLRYQSSPGSPPTTG
jgi:CHASE3 domain sensor protein